MARATERQQGLIVQRRSHFSLARIVERMAAVSAPRHRDLVRGMVSELDSIADPSERRRFALGAIAAVLRLSVSGYGGATVHAPESFVGFTEPYDGATLRGPSMPKPTTRQLLRRHAVAFAVSLMALTAILLVNYATKLVPRLSAREASGGTVVEALLLAVPFTIAMTIPMAVFVAVSWVFTRLGVEGTLVAAQREQGGVRRLITPVLGVAAGIAALTLVSNTQILPRTNGRLAAVLEVAARAPTDRTMTVGELREAARSARADTRPEVVARAVGFEVEVQKKFALAAACVFLALAGAAIALRFPRGGVRLVVAASGVVFSLYYVALIAGETLADRQMVSPFAAMWMPNALLLVVALLVWRWGSPRPAHGAESLAIGG